MESKKEHSRLSQSADHYTMMAESEPDPKALEEFKRPAYAARRLIRTQGEQLQQEND